ncbi:MAG: hypothetical protein A3C07_03195 [Candidatus Sungbacteria bacterium RIFCSPHIGHO2_02_FULL_47_11]|uniref:Uncharacterized protein n=1 Tax=Candidatus Sungbacteria bacterium RIFCSPHIGHO2_02_FULL_47_11 TaxID=1802270 RepID=A0A1G2KLE7_9BACT|nr:MAG: hypothetical protein A3C07_03195 [Candidatus Sungbacteria bacterium RIFCSPHIGHO2_02_FULL_47_11]
MIWIIRHVHKIISFHAVKERVSNEVVEVATYAFEDVRCLAPSMGYLLNDHPAYSACQLCHIIERSAPDLIIVAGRRFVGTLVKRYCLMLSKRLARKVQVVEVPHPLLGRALHPYEVNAVLRRVEGALRLCVNSSYTGFHTVR